MAFNLTGSINVVGDVSSSGFARFQGVGINYSGNLSTGSAGSDVALRVEGNTRINKGYLLVINSASLNEYLYYKNENKSLFISTTSSNLSVDPQLIFAQDGVNKAGYGWDDDGDGNVQISNYSTFTASLSPSSSLGGIKFSTSGSGVSDAQPKVYISNFGNVGINTITPGQRLEVSGSISASSAVEASLFNVGDSGYNFINHNRRIVPNSTTDNISFSGAGLDIEGNFTGSGHLEVSGSISGSNLRVGANHVLTGLCATIAGGIQNSASAACSVVGGGKCNSNLSTTGLTVIGGGHRNIITENDNEGSVILGGQDNCILDDHDQTIVAGRNNIGEGSLSFIGGGRYNYVGGTGTVVTGGCLNSGSGACSVIGGGKGNCTAQNISTIAGGLDNTIVGPGDSNTIAGGFNNCISGSSNSFVAGVLNTVKGGSAQLVLGSGISLLNSSTSLGTSTLHTQNINVTGSTTANAILKISRRESTPGSPEEGMIIASGSAGASVLYYYDGTAFRALH